MPSQTPRHGVGAIGAGHLAHLALPVAGCHHVKHGLLFFGSAHRPCLSAGLVLEGPSETQLTSTMPRWSRDSLKLPAPAALAGPVSHLATAKSRAICGWSNKKRWGFARSLRKWTSACAAQSTATTRASRSAAGRKTPESATERIAASDSVAAGWRRAASGLASSGGWFRRPGARWCIRSTGSRLRRDTRSRMLLVI